MYHGLQHQTKRKQTSVSNSKKSTSLEKNIDRLAYAVSILSLLFTLDQVKIIWLEQRVDGVSLLSWLFYTLNACVWLSYGFVHKERVVVVTNCLWVIFSILIVIGIAVYS